MPGQEDLRRPGPSVAACTVVSQGNAAAARRLAETYRVHHPDHEFVVLSPDAQTPDRLGLDRDEFHRLAIHHGGDDLADALAPLLLARLLDEYDVAVLLAPETEVYAPFADVTSLAVEHGLVITPSVLTPLPFDGDEPVEVPGVYDGFLAVGAAARPFLEYWAERARQRPPRSTGGTYTWPDLVPGLFTALVVRDPGLSVGFWNLHERPLGDGEHGPSVAGESLRFAGFRGYAPQTPWLLSSFCAVRPRVRLSADAVLRRLTDDYAARLDEADSADSTDSTTEGYATLPGGEPVTMHMRQLYHEAVVRADRPDPFGRPAQKLPPHPFGDDGGLAFQQWLAEPPSPDAAASGLTRLAVGVWHGRGDLQAAFPRPTGQDGPGYRRWCATHGVEEGPMPDWALPHDPPPPAPPVDEFGVNVAGYLTAELGLGEMGRIVQRTIAAAGIPMTSVVEEHSLSHAVRTGLGVPDTVGHPRFGISLLAVNADFTQLLLDHHPEVGPERHRIGLWAWELEDFPAFMHEGFALVDEVWTPSEFATRSIAAFSPVPVKTIPVPVLDPGPLSRPHRADGDPVRFLFLFDFNSTAGRKNPGGAVTAFRRAFEGRNDARLTVKATNGHLHVPALERLYRDVGDDPRIEVLDTYLTVGELDGLYAASDAYVSLHRSEGFGLTVAEAMVRGLPVIATDYSATTEFFVPEAGWPIPYRTVEVGPGWTPYPAGGHWADPDLDAAAEAMRAVADQPAEARRRGAAGREHVLRTRRLEDAAAWVLRQLQDIDHARRPQIEVAPSPAPPLPPRRHPVVAGTRRMLRPLRRPATPSG